MLALAGPAQDGVRPPEEGLDDRSSFVTYDIRAELDNEAKYLRGSETITWTNRSGESAPGSAPAAP